MSKGIIQESKLFVPFPDGKAILYELKGESIEPIVEEELKVNLETKKTNVVKIPIANWLPTKQCFSVNTQLKAMDPSIVLKGGTAIDLNGKEQKEYKLNLMCYNEGTFSFTVTFTNVITKE